MAKALS
jgi:hypothetical protein